MDDNVTLTAAQAATRLGPDVTRHTIAWWVASGKLAPVGRRGRSPLYLWADLREVERQTRRHPNSARNPDRGRPQLVQAAA